LNTAQIKNHLKFSKKLQERLEKKYAMKKLQTRILNCPVNKRNLNRIFSEQSLEISLPKLLVQRFKKTELANKP
jgi:hypothetical protein